MPNTMICEEERNMDMKGRDPSDNETVETKTTCSSDNEFEGSSHFPAKSLSTGDIANLSTMPIPSMPSSSRSSSLPMQKPVRRSSIMSVQTLDESLRGDSSYLEAARLRRLRRKHKSPPQDGAPKTDEKSHEKEDLSVKFDSVEIREFAIQIGDNPSVSSGPPITIGWDHFSEDKIDIDTYEENLPPRRNSATMIIPARARLSMLMENSDLSRGQITEATKKVFAAKHNRNKTAAMLEMPKVVFAEEKMEVLKRGIRNMMNKEKKRKEKEMIKATLEADRRESQRRLAVDVCD